MSSPLSSQVEQASAEFERQRAAISGIQGNPTGSLTTVVAKNRAVVVTANSPGAVTAIRFPTAAFRSMAGPESSDLLVSAIRQRVSRRCRGRWRLARLSLRRVCR
jgi:hypothetical protein